MTDEERYSLMKKVVKKITPRSIDVLSKLNFYKRGKENSIKYDISKINEIIKKYNFPKNYNFIDEEKPTVHIKNQKYCGSCWAFSATTALAYRFHKLGIDIDLSPQYLLSCYIKNCSNGNYIIDTQLYLVKNGTTTEGCMPYSSADGETIEQCPTECKDGEELKKYYSKNAYSIFEEYNDKENYYDIVTVIMDQLINYGPVVSFISVYKDFYGLTNKEQCSNFIYSYDQHSDYIGGHAVVIVGYGFENEQFYWIIQNSWGEEFCDNGFAKIQFGQIGIEKIGFSEPYIESNSTEKEIDVKFQFNENCKLKFNVEENNTEDDYFEMTFMGVDSPYDDFYYQCGIPKINDKKEGVCNYELADLYYNHKGYYKFKDYQSLKINNIFNLDFSDLPQNQIYFY